MSNHRWFRMNESLAPDFSTYADCVSILKADSRGRKKERINSIVLLFTFPDRDKS